MFSKLINFPLRELQQSQEAYCRSLVGEQQWAYEQSRTAHGPIGGGFTGWYPKPRNNTLHPNHSEEEGE